MLNCYRYVISTLCGSKDCYSPPAVVTLVFWIGYFNSTLNPLIYAYFNREFRVAFKKTLQSCCHFTSKVMVCSKCRSRRDPVTYSNGSSDVHMNNHLRTDLRADGTQRLSYNVSEGEVINLQNEAVI